MVGVIVTAGSVGVSTFTLPLRQGVGDTPFFETDTY